MVSQYALPTRALRGSVHFEPIATLGLTRITSPQTADAEAGQLQTQTRPTAQC